VRVHFLEGVLVSVGGLARNTGFVGSFGLVHTCDCIDVVGGGLSVQVVSVEDFFRIHNPGFEGFTLLFQMGFSEVIVLLHAVTVVLGDDDVVKDFDVEEL